MPDFLLRSAIPKITTGTIIGDDTAVEGKVLVRIDSFEDNNSVAPEQTHCVNYIAPAGMEDTIPTEGTIGLILFEDIDLDRGGTEGYWIGTIFEKFKAANQKTPKKSGLRKFKSPNNKTSMGVSDSGGGIVSNKTKMFISGELAELKYESSGIEIKEKAINIIFNDINEETKAKISMSKSATEINSDGVINLRSAGGFNARINGGDFVVTGNVELNSKDEGRNRYESINMFYVKSKSVTFNSGGIINFGGALMDIKLGGNIWDPLNHTFNVECVTGDLNLHTGIGDIEIVADNNMQTAKVDIRCGTSVSPIASGLNLTNLAAKLSNQVSWGLDSSITLNNMNATVDAFKDIELNALTGNIKAAALTNIDLEALINAKIESMSIEIKGGIKVMVETMLLDLKGAKVIDLGPKVGIPTGTGCFMSVSHCPILSIPLTSERAIG